MYEDSPFLGEDVGLFLEDERDVSESDVLYFWSGGNHRDCRVNRGKKEKNYTQWRAHLLDERFLHFGADVVEIQHDYFDCRHHNTCILMLELRDYTFTDMFRVFYIGSTIF